MYTETIVKEVSVYRNGCTVSRKGIIHLMPGENNVQISGLTSSAYTDTMQLRFAPSVSAYAVHIVEREEEERESNDLTDQINETKELIAALKSQAEMWKNGAAIYNSANVTVKEIEEYIIAYPERIKTVKAEIRKLEKELKQLQKQLNEAASRDARPLIGATLKAVNEGDYPFELVYQDTAAYWNSQYEVHTDGESSPLEIRVRAEVRQSTGEDWKNVKMSLRTGMPVYSASLPVLKPVWLDYQQPMRDMVYGMARPMMMKAAAAPTINSAMRTEAEESMLEDTAAFGRIEMPEADVSSSDTMTEYTLGSVYDVASGKDGLTVDLQKFTLDAKYVIKAVPKKDIKAYLLAEINTKDLPMIINGNAAVYLDGVYTGTCMIAPDYGKDTYAIALGSQERITLSRKANKKKSSSAIFKNVQSSAYECEITVTNGKDIPVTITLYDQIPVTRQDGIKVEVIKTDKADHNEKTGELEWLLDLKPQESRTLHVEYVISWPKDKSLNQSSF